VGDLPGEGTSYSQSPKDLLDWSRGMPPTIIDPVSGMA